MSAGPGCRSSKCRPVVAERRVENWLVADWRPLESVIAARGVLLGCIVRQEMDTGKCNEQDEATSNRGAK